MPRYSIEVILLLSNIFQALSPNTKVMLLNDVNTLASAGRLAYAPTVFDLTSYLSVEEHYVPLREGMGILSAIAHRVETRPLYPKVKKAIRALVESRYNELAAQTANFTNIPAKENIRDQ